MSYNVALASGPELGAPAIRSGRSNRNQPAAIDACDNGFAVRDEHGAERVGALFNIIEGEPFGLIEKCASPAYVAPAFSSMATIDA